MGNRMMIGRWGKCGLVVFALILPQIGCSTNASPSPGASPPRSTGLVIVPDPISIGTLKPGQVARVKATLRNPRTESVRLDRVETSCPCVSVESLPTIAANGTSEIEVVFNPSEEPDFRGALSVELIGKDDGAKSLFETRANLEVVSESR